MRDRIWKFCKKYHIEGRVLSTPLKVLYCVLYPLKGFYWYMSGVEGYQPHTDTWLIHGRRISADFLLHVTKPSNEYIRFCEKDGLVVAERLDDKS